MGYGLPLMPNKCGMDEEVKSKGVGMRAPGAGGEAGEGWESGIQLKRGIPLSLLLCPGAPQS